MTARRWCGVGQWLVAVICLAVLGVSGTTASHAQDLLPWVPPGANAVAVIQVHRAFNSPYGVAHGWSKTVAGQYRAGMITASAGTEAIMRATYLGPMQQTPAMFGVYLMRDNVIMANVAKHENGTVEKLGQTFAVLSPRSLYLVGLGPRLLGSMMPPDRQQLARWVSAGTSNGAGVSPYIHDAVKESEKFEIVVAVDLQDMLHPAVVSQMVANSPALRGKTELIAKLSSVFDGFRGVRILVSAREQLWARVAFDFSMPLDADAAQIKGPVLDFFGTMGAHLPALESLPWKASGQSVVVDGEIGEGALRKILTLINSPTPESLGGSSQVASTQAPETAVHASIRYYQGVVEALTMLDVKNQNANDYNRTAMWHESYAKKIEQLPRMGVDPELLAWGADVCSKLRALAVSLSGEPVQIDKLNRTIQFRTRSIDTPYANTPYGFLYRPLFVTTDNNVDQVRAQQQQLVEKGSSDRENIWNMLREDKQAIAAKMQQKYMIDFDTAGK